MSNNEIVRIIDAKICGHYQLRLKFADGIQKTVDVTNLLKGPIFEPLKDPEEFAKGKLDNVCGTVVWPNGADIAPETLYSLEPIDTQSHNNRLQGIAEKHSR
jgi:hypothetical protein